MSVPDVFALFERLVATGVEMLKQNEEDGRDDLNDEALVWCLKDSAAAEEIVKQALEEARARVKAPARLYERGGK